MNASELQQLMVDSASDAVTLAKKEFDITLDFSAASIAQVDIALHAYLDTYQGQVKEHKALFTLCNIYGAYIGETFRKLAGGVWVFDETNEDAPAVFLHLESNTYAFSGICYERLVNNNETRVVEYFNKALANHAQ